MTTTTLTTTFPTFDALTLDQVVRWLGVQDNRFCRSVATYYHEHGRLTDNQLRVARDIYNEVRDRELATEAVRAAEIAEARAAVDAMRDDDIVPGFYVGPNGIVWHVKRGKSGHLYALRHDDATGQWVKVTGAVRALRADKARGHLRPLDTATAGRIGKRTGRCLVCSKVLSDPHSVAAGIGPTCASRL